LYLLLRGFFSLLDSKTGLAVAGLHPPAATRQLLGRDEVSAESFSPRRREKEEKREEEKKRKREKKEGRDAEKRYGLFLIKLH